jgi:two-component system, LytTR family, response regulator
VVTKSLVDWPQQKPEAQPNGAHAEAVQPEVLRGWGDRIALKSDRKIVLLRTAEIEWIEAAGNYVNIHARQSTHFVRETMHSIEQKMPADRFMRIHRSTIVNLDRVKELKAGANGEYVVLMQDGQALTLSRGYRSQLDKLMR